MTSSDAEEQLLAPDRLFSRQDVLAADSPVPALPGVYAWHFSDMPHAGIDPGPCHTFDSMPLLYVGIAPRRPPTDGSPASRRHLRQRLRYHYRGNAAGSTLRLSLGCLLADVLPIELSRVGSGRRLTFSTGELLLSQWMAEHTSVCWAQVTSAWLVEDSLIGDLSLR